MARRLFSKPICAKETEMLNCMPTINAKISTTQKVPTIQYVPLGSSELTLEELEIEENLLPILRTKLLSTPG